MLNRNYVLNNFSVIKQVGPEPAACEGLTPDMSLVNVNMKGSIVEPFREY